MKETWLLEIKENEETGELFIELPPEVLNKLNWEVGDRVTWNQLKSKDGWTIKKITPKKKHS